MIDIENELFTRVSKAVTAKYPKAFVSGEYVRTPSVYPAVFFTQIDNQTWKLSRDSGSMENHVAVNYEVNVFATGDDKKSKCKKIITLISDSLAGIGFTRTTLTPVANENDATVYRIVGRYRAIVGKNGLIYRR